jgi:hypothetical protein
LGKSLEDLSSTPTNDDATTTIHERSTNVATDAIADVLASLAANAGCTPSKLELSI